MILTTHIDDTGTTAAIKAANNSTLQTIIDRYQSELNKSTN